ncbi:MAG: hypothetical protein RIT07_598 [Bacteroidota bacterium]
MILTIKINKPKITALLLIFCSSYTHIGFGQNPAKKNQIVVEKSIKNKRDS